MSTASGPSVSIGQHVVRIPLGWSVTQKHQITLCGSYDLKQRVALIDGGQQRPEDVPTEGQRTHFRGRVFRGHLEEGLIPPPWFERILFGRKPHHRFEWVIQHNDFCIVAVYLSELSDDRTRIRDRVEELLNAIEIDA